MALDGVWRGDDEGNYYIQQRGQDVWWLGLFDDGSFHKGLEFANVFHGRLNSDSTAITGQWADVPRGATMSSGILNLDVSTDSNGTPILVKKVDTGGFGGSLWTFETDAPDRIFPPLSGLWGQINKDSYHAYGTLETLEDNLQIVKDAVVLYGKLACGEDTCSLPFGNSFPKSLQPDYAAFLNLNGYIQNEVLGDQIDADMYCYLLPNTSFVPDDLFVDIPVELQQKVADRLSRVHPEIVMFARQAKLDAHGQFDLNSPPLLPGWAEKGGNSVLINGSPCNGCYQVDTRKGVTSIGPDKMMPKVGDEARVTGVMVFDTSHDGDKLEIHPVYAIDFITATSTPDHTGVWGDAAGSYTYYVHQLYNTIWMCVLSPLRAVLFAGVFRGQIQPDGLTVTGDWTTVPLTGVDTGGPMTLQIDPGNLKMVVNTEYPLINGRVLRKLYDKAGSPCPLLGKINVVVQGARLCEVKEIAGATVSYTAVNPALDDIPSLTYLWTVQGATIVGSNTENTVRVVLPGKGTKVTISVDITVSTTECAYHGDRTFVTVDRQQANQLQLWCEIRQNALQTVTGSISRAKPSPSPFGKPTDLPDASTLRTLEHSLTQMLEMVRRLHGHRTK